MDLLRGLVTAGFIALAGTGGAEIVINLDTASPRRMAVSVASAVIGILVGGFLLARKRPGA